MNYQRERWSMFFHKDIEQAFNEFFEDYVYNGIRISCVPDASQVVSIQRQGNVQKYAPLYVTFSAKNENNNSSMSVFNSPVIKLMSIPYFAEDGFKGKEATIKPVSRLEYASGWYIDVPEKGESGYKYRLTYRSKYRREFYFTDKGEVKSAVTKSAVVPVLVFLKALTGYTFAELMAFYPFKQVTSYVFDTTDKDKEPDRTECCRIVFEKFYQNYTKNNTDYVDNLQNLIFNSPNQRAGSEKIPRYLDMESYHRFHGYTIKKIIDSNGIPEDSGIVEGVVISETIASILDNQCELRECILTNNNGKDVVVKRMYADNLSRNLSPKEVLYAYYQYLLFLNGMGSLHDSQELSNLILEPIDRVARRAIEFALISALRKINENINNNLLNPFDGLAKHMETLATSKEAGRMNILSIIKNDNSDRTLDITNVVSETDMAGKVKREKSDAQRDVHASHYGRLDMNDTPESIEVGHTVSLCSHSSIDNYGFITVPLYRVVNGKVDTSKTVYLSFLDEKWKYIAPVSVNLDDYADDELVPDCTFNGQVVKALKSSITYKRRNAEDYYGSTLNTVPLITSNGVKRFTLASSGYKQATPLLAPERPWVSTGFGGNDIGVVRTKEIIDEYFKSIGKFDVEIPDTISMTLTSWAQGDKHIEAVFTLNEPIENTTMIKYTTIGVSRSITNTMRQYKLASGSKNHVYYKDDIVLYSNDVNIDSDRNVKTVGNSSLVHGERKCIDHDFALGQNARILYKTFEGFGYEDSVQINERFVNKFGLATIFTTVVRADTSSGLSGNNRNSDYEFKAITSYKNRNIDWLETSGRNSGLPKLGTYLKPGDVAIGKVFKQADGTEIPRPVELNVNQEGHVWYADKHMSSDGKYMIAEVILAKIIPMDIGDKLTGGHGNKATVSRILKEHEMPYFEDGTTPDIIFDPLGCIARENVGQITECLLAEIGKKTNTTMIVNQGTPTEPNEIMKMANESGIEMKTLYNPKTGEPYKEKAFIGSMYIVRSTHTCFSKYMAMGSQKHLSVNFQPTREGPEHAQRISEQTTWWYRAAGGEEVLNSLFSVQSDDTVTFDKMHEAIIHGKDFGDEDGEMYESMNGYRIQAYTRFFGLNVVVDKENQTSYIEPINTEKAEELFGVKSIISGTIDRDVKALSDPEKFGSSKLNRRTLRDDLQKYGLIKVSQEFISPVFLNSSEFTRCIPAIKVKCNRNAGGLQYNVTYCGMTRSEIKAIFNESEKGNHMLFGTISEPVDCDITYDVPSSVKSGRGKPHKIVNVNKVFILFTNDYLSEYTNPKKSIGLNEHDFVELAKTDFNCFNLNHGAKHFFNLIADDNLYDLNGCYNIYRTIYGYDDIVYEDSLESMKSSEDSIYTKEMRDANDNKMADYIAEDAADDAITQASAIMDMARLEEMLNVTGYTLKSFMTQYVVVPPMILRPIGDVRNPFRAFTKILKTILNASTGDISGVYNIIDAETRQKKPSRNNKKQGKTIIQEFTSHNTKTSVLRDLVLAKPVSYSGRSVISVDPTLKLGTAKIPAIMLVTIFREHLIAALSKADNTKLYACMPKNTEGEIDTKVAGSVLAAIVNCDLATSMNKYAFINNLANSSSYKSMSPSEKDNLFTTLKDELYNMLTELSRKYPVLLSRDPALWALSIRGVIFIPSSGYTIRIHPLLCMGFNADFDGDQMSCVAPIHAHARDIVMKNMMVGQPLINPQEVTSVFEFAQDVLLGHYFATHDEPNYNGVLDGTLNGITDIITITEQDSYTSKYTIDNYGFDNNFNHREVRGLYDKVCIGTRQFSDTIIVNYANRKYLTTIGRLIFNMIYMPKYTFLKEPDDKLEGFYKLRFGEITKAKSKIFTEFTLYMQQVERNGNFEDNIQSYDKIESFRTGIAGVVLSVADRLMRFGFECADLSGVTLSYWDFMDIHDDSIDGPGGLVDKATEKADEITIRRRLGLLDDDMANSNLKRIWNDVKKESEAILGKRLAKNNNLSLMIKSGARGSIANLNNICGFIGTVVNSKGEEMPEPIKGNFLRGLNNEEVAINSFNGRSVKIHTQQGSSKNGEKMRNLVYLLEHFRTCEETDYVCSAKPTYLSLIYNISYDVAPGTPIIFSKEPTADMTEDEASDYKDFIRRLEESDVNLLDNDEARRTLATLFIEYVAIEGCATKVKIKKSLCKEHHNMLRYRTIELNVLGEEYRRALEDKCASDYTLRNGVNYIITDEALKEIEKLGMDSVPFYTMINCKCGDGTICPRCFGYRYEDFRYPDGNSQVGYTVASSISQKGLQAAQNLHKSGGNSKKSANLYSDNVEKAFSAPITLNHAVNNIPEEDILNIYTELVTNGKFLFTKEFMNAAWCSEHYNTTNDDIVNDDEDAMTELLNEAKKFSMKISSIARFNGDVKLFRANGMTIVEVVDRDDYGVVYDFTWFPIWNQSITIDVSCDEWVNKGDALIRLPSIQDMLDVSNDYSNPEEQYELSSKLAMDIWYTVLKSMTSDGGFAARNFELTTKAFTEVGTAQESNHSEGIVAGRDYPIYKLNNAGVRYCNTIPSNFNVIRGRGKVFSCMALGHFLQKAASCSVMKTMTEKTSSLSDAVVGIDRYQDSYPESFSQIDRDHSDMDNIVTSHYSSITDKMLGQNIPDSIKSIGQNTEFDGSLADDSGEFEDVDNFEIIETPIDDKYEEDNYDDDNEVIDAEIIEDIQEDNNDDNFSLFADVVLPEYDESDDDDYDYKRNKKKNKKNKKHLDGETNLF